jgi:hypothetical protein
MVTEILEVDGSLELEIRVGVQGADQRFRITDPVVIGVEPLERLPEV